MTARTSAAAEVREWLLKWKEHHEVIRKLIHLLNTYTPSVVRAACMSVLIELIEVYPKECVPILVQGLGLGHMAFQDQYVNCKSAAYLLASPLTAEPLPPASLRWTLLPETRTASPADQV